LSSFLLALVSVSTSAGFLNAEPPPARPQEARIPAPGEGVLCLWALTSAAAEIGRQCRVGQNPAFQAELERSVDRFDHYVLANGLTAEEVAQFKRQQGLSGAPGGQACTGDLISFYDHMAAGGPEALRSAVDGLISRPGRPSWGDCL
jgi:hypothetical protein